MALWTAAVFSQNDEIKNGEAQADTSLDSLRMESLETHAGRFAEIVRRISLKLKRYTETTPTHVLHANENYVIVIDPGHGGGWLQDKGSSAVLDGETYYERDVMWDYGVLLEQKLKALGYQNVFKTKEAAGDSTMSIFGRMKRIQNFGKDNKKEVICISLHWNNYEYKGIRGTEIYIAERKNSKSRKLAECIQGSMRQIMDIHGKGFYSQGIVERDYKLLRENPVAVLIEIGFASNEHDMRKIVFEKDNITEAMAEGVDTYAAWLEKSHLKQSQPSVDSTALAEIAKLKLLNGKLIGWGWRKSDMTKSIEKMLAQYNAIYEDPRAEKNLYLTFDNGYENGNTAPILDVLKANGVKVTFFITGHYLKNNHELVARMLDEGHIVGNHSANHLSLPKLDYESTKEEVLELERMYYDLFEQKMSYFRPPSGEYSERSLAIVSSLGYRTVFWSFAYDDWDAHNLRGKQFAYNKIVKGVRDGAIILLHATSKDNADALDQAIKDLKKQGYQFKSLDEINHVSPGSSP